MKTISRSIILIAFVSTGLLITVAELGARFCLGLGDPPLFMSDPDVELMNKPLQRGKQFGNSYCYNAYSMRSSDFSIKKTDPNELRILVFGDSVINGGNLTDQKDLATEILQAKLAETLSWPVVVGNISAGMWDPGNFLAYAKKYGLFDADIIVIVLSSHDYVDGPTLAPMVGTDPMCPTTKPVLAIWEAAFRYFPRYLPFSKPTKTKPSVNNKTIEKAKSAIYELVHMSRDSGADVVIGQHLERMEIEGRLKTGHTVFMKMAQRMNLPIVQIGDSFAEAVKSGVNPYRDNIHPNAIGQTLIAECIYNVILDIIDRSGD